MNRNLGFLEELYKSDFSSISDWNIEGLFVHFDSGFAVVHDRFLDEFNDFRE